MQRIRLHQQPLDLHSLQQVAESRDLTAVIGDVGFLTIDISRLLEQRITWAIKCGLPETISSIEPCSV